MGKKPWGRNAFGEGNRELASGELSLRILLVIPRRCQVYSWLWVWSSGEKPALCSFSER